MGLREPDGGRGSEILDKSYVGLPEFTAVIRPAGWSTVRSMQFCWWRQTADLGSNPMLSRVSGRCPSRLAARL